MSGRQSVMEGDVYDLVKHAPMPRAAIVDVLCAERDRPRRDIQAAVTRHLSRLIQKQVIRRNGDYNEVVHPLFQVHKATLAGCTNDAPLFRLYEGKPVECPHCHKHLILHSGRVARAFVAAEHPEDFAE